MSINKKNEFDTNDHKLEKVYDFPPADLDFYYAGIKGKTVLDVGCGTGLLGAALSERENVCYGITISEKEALAAKARLKDVFVCDLTQVEKLPFPLNFFDVIICADILEHLPDPVSVLKKLKPHLKPKGLIIVSIPNIANFKIRISLLMGKFNYEPFGILDETHLRFFTLQTGMQLLERAGFLIESVKYTNWNWNLSRIFKKIFPRIELRLRNALTQLQPKLFATQFMIYAKNN